MLTRLLFFFLTPSLLLARPEPFTDVLRAVYPPGYYRELAASLRR